MVQMFSGDLKKVSALECPLWRGFVIRDSLGIRPGQNSLSALERCPLQRMSALGRFHCTYSKRDAGESIPWYCNDYVIFIDIDEVATDFPAIFVYFKYSLFNRKNSKIKQRKCNKYLYRVSLHTLVQPYNNRSESSDIVNWVIPSIIRYASCASASYGATMHCTFKDSHS